MDPVYAKLFVFGWVNEPPFLKARSSLMRVKVPRIFTFSISHSCLICIAFCIGSILGGIFYLLISCIFSMLVGEVQSETIGGKLFYFSPPKPCNVI